MKFYEEEIELRVQSLKTRFEKFLELFDKLKHENKNNKMFYLCRIYEYKKRQNRVKSY